MRLTSRSTQLHKRLYSAAAMLGTYLYANDAHCGMSSSVADSASPPCALLRCASVSMAAAMSSESAARRARTGVVSETGFQLRSMPRLC